MENLLGLGGGEFGLASEEVKVKSFLAEGDALGELAKAILKGFLSLLKFSLLQKLVSVLGDASIGRRAGDKKERQSEGREGRGHSGRLW